MRIVADGATLTVTLKNQRPVELVDLTTSFLALGQAYEDFVYTRGFDPVAGNVRLYIRELKSGSIVAELASMAEQASFIIDNLDVFAGFVTQIDEITKFFVGASNDKAGFKFQVQHPMI